MTGPAVPNTTADTLGQGLVAAAIVGASTGALEVLNAGDFTWRTVATAAGTAALMSVLAYLQHAYAAPYFAIRRSIKGR
jgi:hypothetical protein